MPGWLAGRFGGEVEHEFGGIGAGSKEKEGEDGGEGRPELTRTWPVRSTARQG
jgi:hypothetical protein